MRLRPCRSLFTFLAIVTFGSVASAHPGSAIAVHPDGRVYFVDTGGGVFVIQKGGEVIRHEGPAFHWFAFDTTSRFRDTVFPRIPNGELRAVGAHPSIILSSDVPVTIGDGTFFFPETVGDSRVRIVAVDPSGARSVRATLPPVLSAGQAVPWLNGLAAGPNGSLYYTENRSVRIVDRHGRVTTLARDVTVPRCAFIPGIDADLRPYLRGLAVDADGNVFVAASGCAAVLKITPRGKVMPILRASPPWAPTAVALANGEVYVLEYTHTPSDDRREWLPRVRKGMRDGKVVILTVTNRR